VLPGILVTFAPLKNTIMTELQLFNNDFNEEVFEDQSSENGFTYWTASSLMKMLGYKSMTSFGKAINRAMTTCNTLNIPIMENFVQVSQGDGRSVTDFKLSRFACYLVTMNADSKNPKVAQAQAYFAALAGAVTHYIEEANQIERLIVREEISEKEVSLSSVAKRAHVENYAKFKGAGYRGMYNMPITKLKEIRNIPEKKSPLEFMGKDELAANLFRITQTELRIKNNGIEGQSRLEAAAEIVGRTVRETMIQLSGIAPENLQPDKEIKDVKKELKLKSKRIKQIDSGKK
jgi:DNA-damage-inducible protein D